MLLALSNSDDRIVFVSGSPAERKLWALCRQDRTEREREIGKVFSMNILYSTNCVILQMAALPPLPQALEHRVKAADQYLAQAQVAVPDAQIISTDQPLLDALRAHGCSCQHRDAFLAEYLQA